MNLQTVLHLQSALARFDVSREQDLLAYLLEWAETIEHVDSALLLRRNQDGFGQQIWRQLDGKTVFNDWLPLDEMPWMAALDTNRFWIESSGTLPCEIPELTPPYKDRVYIPINNGTTSIGAMILSSALETGFGGWDPEVAQFWGGMIASRIQYEREQQELRNQLYAIQQRARQNPPLLRGFEQLSSATLKETEAQLTSVQHNLDTVQGYTSRLLELLKFCNDEIRIKAGGESQQRIESQAQRLQLPLIESDLDLLLSDCNDAMVKMRFFLTHIALLGESEEDETQFDLLEMLHSLVPVVFSSRLVQFDIQRDSDNSSSMFGRADTLRKAFLLLLFSIEQQLSEEEESTVQVWLEDWDEELALFVRFSADAEEDEMEFFLEGEEYFHQVLEEHQAHYRVDTKDSECTLVLRFPVMFGSDDEEDEAPIVYQGSAMELPALPASFDWDALAAGETVPEPSKPKEKSTAVVSGKILLVGEDALYLRSLRRVLSHQHEVFLASHVEKAVELLDAHPDMSLILCDLLDHAPAALALTEHLEEYAPQLFGRVALLVGRRLNHEAQELAHRLEPMSSPRNALYQAIEEFIQQRMVK